VNEVDQQFAKLSADWPGYKIWYVPLALGGYTWCAHKHGTHRRTVIHADTAAHLDEYIRDREAETATDNALSDVAARDLAEGDPLDPRD
jgi:hypothetical protein